jgi:hypothetical protein
MIATTDRNSLCRVLPLGGTPPSACRQRIWTIKRKRAQEHDQAQTHAPKCNHKNQAQAIKLQSTQSYRPSHVLIRIASSMHFGTNAASCTKNIARSVYKPLQFRASHSESTLRCQLGSEILHPRCCFPRNASLQAWCAVSVHFRASLVLATSPLLGGSAGTSPHRKLLLQAGAPHALLGS